MNEKLEFNSKKFDETSKSNKKIREDISIVITNFQKKINNLSNNSSDVFFSSIIDRNKLSSDFLNKLKLFPNKNKN